MSHIGILFDANGQPISHGELCKRIDEFGDSYSNATRDIIDKSKDLDKDGDVFIECASRILSNFGMTRSGPFHKNLREKLRDCWDVVGANILEIHYSVNRSGLPRDRYIMELGFKEREELIAEVWLVTKKLLPFTMGGTSYGLVGASKILFSVLPEIVLPVDNAEWLHVFKTVDIGDVLHHMVFDIQEWERITGTHFNDLDPKRRMTTIPSVYNVMAMYARP